MRIATLAILAASTVLAACASGEFAAQRDIDRCVESEGVEDSAFRLKQSLTVQGVTVTVIDYENLSETEREALEACIENQVNGRVLGTDVALSDPLDVPAAEPGKLALPVQYPLLPGDTELWSRMSKEQQERALRFLANGSTIRASLESD